jgi:hypothetical protein
MRAAARIRTEDLVVTWGVNESEVSLPQNPCTTCLANWTKATKFDVSMSICFLFFVYFYGDFVRRCSKVSARFATALAICAHFLVLVQGWQSVAMFTFMPSAPTSPLLAGQPISRFLK